jgi:hypothetical protein
MEHREISIAPVSLMRAHQYEDLAQLRESIASY